MSAAHHDDAHATGDEHEGPKVLATTTSSQGKVRRTLQVVRPEPHDASFLAASAKGFGITLKHFARNLFLGQRIPLAGVAHQNGTIRFGHDPRTSALDVDCKAHDVDNLYVVDASFFPSSAAVNPALTIIANALRVGDHLKARLA